MFIKILLLFFILIFGYGVFLKIRAIKSFFQPIVPLNKAKEGLVVIQGRISPDNPKIIAPLTNKDCAWYEFQISKRYFRKDDSGNEREEWGSYRGGGSANFLIIEDATDKCIVSSLYGQVYTDNKETWRSETIPQFDLTPEEKQTKKYAPSFIGNIIDDRVKPKITSNDSFLGNIKKQLPSFLMGNLVGLKQTLNIDLTEKKTDLYELNETRLQNNDMVTIYGQYQKVDREKVDYLIKIQDKPFRKDILKQLLNFMIDKNINECSLILYLIKGQSTIISTLPPEKLIRTHFIQIALCISLMLLFGFLLVIIK